MTSTAPSSRKAELRARALKIGPADRTAAKSEALRRLVALPEFARARTVALYSAIADELPLDEVAATSRARGVRTVYPVQSGAELALAVVVDTDSLRVGPRGVREPAPDAPRIGIEEIDAFVVPGVLFDRSCRRLGRGGGHYDRLLARIRAGATAIGICYADRVVDELPEDPWDVAMHAVVTDRFVVRRPTPGSES